VILEISQHILWGQEEGATNEVAILRCCGDVFRAEVPLPVMRPRLYQCPRCGDKRMVEPCTSVD
jgi:DNA-directed RNA polymerase subunit RPC12/RpoP